MEHVGCMLHSFRDAEPAIVVLFDLAILFLCQDR